MRIKLLPLENILMERQKQPDMFFVLTWDMVSGRQLLRTVLCSTERVAPAESSGI